MDLKVILLVMKILGLTLFPVFAASAAEMTCDNKPVTGDGRVTSGYYGGTNGLSGNALKTRLNQLISIGASKCTYKEVWAALKYTDEDPSNRDNVTLFYTGRSVPKSDMYKGGNGPDKWTREHVWPKSHGFKKPTTNSAYTDLHHMRPADKSVNSARNDRDYDFSSRVHDEAPATFWDDDSWEPRDEVKGDAARMVFYMAVRYEGDEPFVPDLTLVDRMTDSGCPHLGKLCVLLRWHREDPVDDPERDRHRKVVQTQGNRNPFIDRPEFGERIWGDKCKR